MGADDIRRRAVREIQIDTGQHPRCKLMIQRVTQKSQEPRGRDQDQMVKGVGLVSFPQSRAELGGEAPGFLILGVDRRLHPVAVFTMGVQRTSGPVGEQFMAWKARCRVHGILEFEQGTAGTLGLIEASACCVRDENPDCLLSMRHGAVSKVRSCRLHDSKTSKPAFDADHAMRISVPEG